MMDEWVDRFIDECIITLHLIIIIMPATLFDTLGTVMANTTALEPFTPINVHHKQLDLMRGGDGGYR